MMENPTVTPTNAPTLTQILLNSQSADRDVRRTAEQQLLAAEERNLDAYLCQLAQELNSEESPRFARQLAGLLLKNAISGTDLNIDKIKRTKWLELSAQTTDFVKKLVITTLNSPLEEARVVACQVISKVGRLELRLDKWPTLLPTLVEFTSPQNTNKLQKKASITAIAFLSEDITILAEELDTELLSDEQKNLMITAVCCVMQDADPDIQLAAYKAFYHTSYFAKNIMNVKVQRDYLMGFLLNGLNHIDLRIQHAAWECVLQLITIYYDVLDAYVEDLGRKSIETIHKALTICNDAKSMEQSREIETVALAAIEFWNTLSEIECDLETASTDPSLAGDAISKNYVKRAKSVLLPVLFQAMSLQLTPENYSDEWTLAMSAGTCLGLCAQVLRDDILEPALQFINQNFSNENWKCREAAVLAYGSIMEGPSSNQLKPLVAQSFETLCLGLNDKSVAVRDTTAWTIGRIASYHIQCIVDLLGTSTKEGLIHVLIQKLVDEPRVASYVCFAIHEIARNLQTVNSISILDPFYSDLAKSLLQTAQRQDALEHNLRASAFEALSEVTEVVQDPRCYEIMNAILQELLALLKHSFNYNGAEEIHQLQGLICGCLNTIISRIGKMGVMPEKIPSELFLAFATIIESSLSRQPNFSSTDIHASSEDRSGAGSEEDAMLAIGTLIQCCSSKIEQHLPALSQVIIKGLQTPMNVRFCRASIGVVCEFATAFNLKSPNIEPYVKTIIPILYGLLHDPSAPITLKPPLITTVGDIVVGMGKNFEPYIDPFLQLLTHASSTQITDGPKNEEWIEYFQELRDSVLEAYSCILHGLMESGHLLILKPYLNQWIAFIESVVRAEMFSVSNFTRALEVTSDLVASFRNELVLHLIETPLYHEMIAKGESSTDATVRKRTIFLKKAVSRFTIT